MPSEQDLIHLNHILVEIELAESFVEGLSFDAFKEDALRYRAVVRCLEIISEASRRLSDDIKAQHPEITWREIAGAGNVYRHDYEDLMEYQIWKTAKNLGHLRLVVEREISQ